MFWAIVTSAPRWLVGRGARVATTPSQSVNDTNPIPAQLISMSPCVPQICRCIKSWSRVDRVCMTLRSMEQFEPSVPRQGSVNFLIRDVPVSSARPDVLYVRGPSSHMARRNGFSFTAGPTVRISFPPAASLVRTRPLRHSSGNAIVFGPLAPGDCVREVSHGPPAVSSFRSYPRSNLAGMFNTRRRVVEWV